MLTFLRPWVFIQLLFLSLVSYASVGNLVLSTGNVEVERGNQLVALAVGGEVFAQDHIFTRANSSAQLKFSDDTVITLGANTDLKVEEVLLDGANSQASFAVGRGGFKTITGKISKLNPERFKLNTPTSTIGIRGTIFSGKIEVEKETFATLRGRISITDRQTQELIDLPEGMMVEILSGTGPQPLREITPEALEEISQSDNDSATDESDSAEDFAGFVGLAESSDDSADNAPHDFVDTQEWVQERRDLETLETEIQLSGWENKVLNDPSGLNQDIKNFDKTILSSEMGGYLDDWTGYVGWGKWDSNVNLEDNTYLVAGVDSAKAADFIEFTIANETVPQYTYSGHMLGEYDPWNQGNSIALDDTNTRFDLTFNFEQSSGLIEGSFIFPEREFGSGEDVLDVIHTGPISGAGFTATSMSHPAGNLSIEGKFFGDKAQAIGGTFELGESGITKASGVFKGSR